MNKKLFSITAAGFIEEFCKPLQQFALSNFMHDITFGKGQISMLVNSEDIFLFYLQNQIPMLCTDESGRTLAEGVYLSKMLENERRDCSILMPLMIKVGSHYGQNYGKNSLHIVKREASCQHLYSLFFDLNDYDFLHWVINNGTFIEDLIAHYNDAANDIIQEASAPENRIVLPNFSDLSSSDHTSDEFKIKVFHKMLNMPIQLSPQQSKCLILLVQGKSAKEIAATIQLSTRTVEHYLERIRKLLGCTTNKELIAAYTDKLFI